MSSRETTTEQKEIPNFHRIETRIVGGSRVVLGRFRQPGVYAAGIMDPTDARTWRGEESERVLFFVLTPEEFAWRKEKPSELDALLVRIVEARPGERFLTGYIGGNPAQSEDLKRCAELVKETELEGDEPFRRWKQQHPFRNTAVENTPVANARHELAVLQKRIRQGERSVELMRELERRQESLANRICELDTVYAALDCNSPGGAWPGLEHMTGDVHIFTTEEHAHNACDYYESCNLCVYQPKALDGRGFSGFLLGCQKLGVERFRVDDGCEPVFLPLHSFVANREMDYIEERGRSLRHAMLQCVELNRLLEKRRERMGNRLMKNLAACLLVWRKGMYQEVGTGWFYVPVRLGEDAAEHFREDFVLSNQTLDTLKRKVDEAGRPASSMTPPGFSGRIVAIGRDDEGGLPVRLLSDESTGTALVPAFTDAEECAYYVEQHSTEDVVVLFSFDDLLKQLGGKEAGLLLDPMGLSVAIQADSLETCRKVREEPLSAFCKVPPSVKEQRERGGVNEPGVEKTESAEKSVPETSVETEQRKPLGFWARLRKRFGKGKNNP